jgi:hypothetical protein
LQFPRTKPENQSAQVGELGVTNIDGCTSTTPRWPGRDLEGAAAAFGEPDELSRAIPELVGSSTGAQVTFSIGPLKEKIE